MNIINKDKFNIYQFQETESVYVAVPKEYTETISNAISEYGNIKAIPSDKTVKGIFLSKENNRFQLDENAQPKDIMINELTVK